MREALKLMDEELGGFGRFQKWTFFLVCLAPVMTGVSVVNHVFIGLTVSYRCSVPECDNGVNDTYTEDFLSFTTPYDNSQEKWSSCTTFRPNSTDFVNGTCESENFDPDEEVWCSDWVYDESLFKSTLVTEFDLTCDRSWQQSFASSAYMLGMPFGALFLGDLADRIGRTKGLCVSILVLGIAEFLASFSVNYYMYLILRFFSGAGGIGTFQNAIIQALEVVSSEWRTFCGMMIKIPFALGETSVAGFAYFIRDWRWLQFVLSVPNFFLLSFWWIMPESIRWLLSKGRFKEAKEVIMKAAKMNKVEVSHGVYSALMTDDVEGEEEDEEPVVKSRSTLDLFRSPRMRNRTLNLMFSWIAITHNFYGLSSNSANFGGNLFINFVAIMLIEVPSYIIAYLILDKLGRKGTLVLLLLVGGSSCFIASMMPQDLEKVIISFSILGKFCVAAAFAVIYIYTIEILPTQYRSLGLGLCSMSARIGGILAPFTAGLGAFYPPLPLIIFGVVSIMSGSLLLLLPETFGSELPQTLEESENHGTDQSLFDFTCIVKRRTLRKNHTLLPDAESKM